jgi:uncharacterized protein
MKQTMKKKDGDLPHSNLKENWPQIIQLAKKAFPNCIFATLNDDGSPHLTPIASLVLRDDCTGFYFEGFTQHMRKNLDRDGRISVLFLDCHISHWISPLVKGSISQPIAVRLNGIAGMRRIASKLEENAFKKGSWIINLARIFNLRGYQILWKPLSYVRDIKFHSFEAIDMGAMNRDHWL